MCLVLWSCVCFWELPRLKFERVESKGISSVCYVFASLNANFVSLRPWQGAHGFSSRSNCKLGRTQGFCAGTTFTPWIFFSLPISLKYIYEDSLSFIFVIAFSVVMIETKFRNLKGNSGAMENHVYTKDFFFCFTYFFSLQTIREIVTLNLISISIPKSLNGEKTTRNLKGREGRTKKPCLHQEFPPSYAPFFSVSI